MTVCIAAINTKSNVVVVASDRMVTSIFPPIEFEHSIPKIAELNDHCVALSSGSALRSKELLDKVRDQIRDKKTPIRNIAEITKAAYQDVRLCLAQDLFLRSRGLNLQFFWEKGAQLLRPELYQLIDKQIATLDFQLELILAGVDDMGPSIYGIMNPGGMECFNSIGFHSIGTGGIHAIGSLINSYSPKRNKIETIYSVYRAKKDAEVAPGVGELIDIELISGDKKIKCFEQDDEIIKGLEGLYKEEKEARLGLIQRSKLSKIDIEAAGSVPESPEGTGKQKQ